MRASPWTIVTRGLRIPPACSIFVPDAHPPRVGLRKDRQSAQARLHTRRTAALNGRQAMARGKNGSKGSASTIDSLFDDVGARPHPDQRVISVRGAREHNLKNVDLTIPRDRLVVFTGLSGSGKSSLAFDTIYAEGQRRYVESLSAYARQFLEMMQKPDVDQIDGLSPAISIEQKTTSRNPRSHRRHGDRDLRLHAPALGACRHSLFARDRPADREPDHQPDGGPRAPTARKRRGCC